METLDNGDTNQRDGDVELTNDSVEVTTSVGTKGPTARYAMPRSYADFIEGIVRADETVKPRFVRGQVLRSLIIDEGHEPNDFHSQQQIVRKVRTVKNKLKKEIQTGNA